jgi:hypothetical protein
VQKLNSSGTRQIQIFDDEADREHKAKTHQK